MYVTLALKLMELIVYYSTLWIFIESFPYHSKDPHFRIKFKKLSLQEYIRSTIFSNCNKKVALKEDFKFYLS